MPDAALLVEVTREPFVESRHAGHAVVARPDGEIVEAWGDPARISLPRSSAKMLQALPLLESGAGDHLGAEQLALACASHSGEARHVERVSAWLSDLGLDEGVLRCGPQESRDREMRDRMIREGRPATRVFNNCSGKHTGFLTLAKHLGANLDYVDPGHPVQVAVRAAEVVVAALLARLGVLDPSDPAVAARIRPPLLNREDLQVGEIRPAAGLLA